MSTTGQASSTGRQTNGLDPTLRRIFVGYLIAQAVAGVGFWVLLASSSWLRASVELVPEIPMVTDAFFVADAIIIATSALGAWGLSQHRNWSVAVLGFTAGGLVYPTLFLMAWVPTMESGEACLAIMVPPSVLSSWILWQVWRAERAPQRQIG